MKFTSKISFLLFSLLLCACGSSKKMVYLNDATLLPPQQITEKYDLQIQKDDQLSIIVNSREPELAAPFNMQLVPQAFNGASSITAGNGSGTPQPFLVDSKGEIDYPVVGKLPVEGLTRMQVADTVRHFLVANGYINDPVVNVKIVNFKVSVLGEVARPGQIKVDGERITLMEALSQAGDLSAYGRRKTVKVIREKAGVRTVQEVDLTDADLLQSPYYYLQQNDLVYVEPNRSKAYQGNISTFWGPILSILSLGTTIGLYFARH